MVEIIAAIGRNREIGKGNRLLWSIPEDMNFFRRTTQGKNVLMGRKTYESIGKPLPNRRNIVISQTMHEINGVEIFPTIESALLAYNDVIVIGGQQIYEQTIDIADVLYLTHIDKDFPDADSYFPEFNSFTKSEFIVDFARNSTVYKYFK